MKRILAVLLVAAIALVLSTPAYSAAIVKYNQIGPLKFCTGCAAVTGQTDSTAKVPNLAAGYDTSFVYAWPKDIAWAAVSDSVPIIVYVSRASAGASTDSVYVTLQTAYGGADGSGAGVGTIPAAFVVSAWDIGNLAQIGANSGGAAFFMPTRARTYTVGPVSTYTVPANSWGSRLFRVVAKSYATGTAPPKFSVYVSYPVVAN